MFVSVFQLWRPGDTLTSADGVTPLLESWESKDHPAQQRLQSYLDHIEVTLGPLPDDGLFLHMEIDVEDPVRLSRHYDLENYLTPVVRRLGHRRFCLATARKYIGGGSQITVGPAVPDEGLPEAIGWNHFSFSLDGSPQRREWKSRIRSALAAAQPENLPAGQVKVHLAWRCNSIRNWVSLWKPTGDTMGPVLGEPHPNNPFNPNDDRITFLALHLSREGTARNSIDIGMWWKLVGQDDRDHGASSVKRRHLINVKAGILKPTTQGKTRKVESSKSPRNPNPTRSGNRRGADNFQLEYWSALSEELRGAGGLIKPTKPQRQNWMAYGAGRTNSVIVAFFNTPKKSIGVYLQIGGQDSKTVYGQLLGQRDDIELAIGTSHSTRLFS